MDSSFFVLQCVEGFISALSILPPPMLCESRLANGDATNNVWMKGFTEGASCRSPSETLFVLDKINLDRGREVGSIEQWEQKKCRGRDASCTDRMAAMSGNNRGAPIGRFVQGKLKRTSKASRGIIVANPNQSRKGPSQSGTKIGDSVQQDEEVATIETDKVQTCGSDATASKEEVARPEPKQEEVKEQPRKEIKDEETKETVPPTSQKSSQPGIHLQVYMPFHSVCGYNGELCFIIEPEPAVNLPSPEPSMPPRKADVYYGEREERQVKMNRMRLRISERLKESQNTAASLTTFNEIDMSNIIELRNTYKDAIIKKHGVKLGFMSAFVKASVFALQEVPAVNASISEAGDTILYRDYIDMSVAVATPKGLVTPVVRNAHLLSFVEIEKAIAELGQK
ncbi:6151_t:CDS:2, partial [Acaulospora colombiana]